jgi:hypothetical protein
VTVGSASTGPTVFGVIGMHRSGTSFAARALALLGVSLGDESGLMPPGPDNTAGYWENQHIKEFDDELLSHLGGAWDFPPLLVPGWEQDPSLAPFAERAHAIVAEAFGSDAGLESPIVIKDPRISLLLPFWRTVLPISTTIVLIRSPHEVARSLGVRRYSVGPDQAVVLWLRYLYAARANDPGHLLVSHEDFFDDLDATLDRIVAHLDLAPPDFATRAAVHEAFDPALRHHRAAPAAAAPSNPVLALAERVWNDGRPDLGVVTDEVAEALAQGWLCSPLDTEALTKARADVIRLKERVKKLNTAPSPAS